MRRPLVPFRLLTRTAGLAVALLILALSMSPRELRAQPAPRPAARMHHLPLTVELSVVERVNEPRRNVVTGGTPGTEHWED